MTTSSTGSSCKHCGSEQGHGETVCPRIREIEYFESGQVKRIVYKDEPLKWPPQQPGWIPPWQPTCQPEPKVIDSLEITWDHFCRQPGKLSTIGGLSPGEQNYGVCCYD